MLTRPVRLAFAAASAAALFALAGCSSGDAEPGAAAPNPAPSATVETTATVTTKLLTFTEQNITVAVGTTVVWQLGDSIEHTVTTGTFTLGGDGLRTEERPDGLIDMKLVAGQTVSYRFDKAGTYTYYCAIHKGMSGTVTVTDDGKAPASTTHHSPSSHHS